MLEQALIESAKQVPSLVVLAIVVTLFIRAWHRDQEERREMRAEERDHERQVRAQEADRYRALLHTTLDRVQTMQDGANRVAIDSVSAIRENTQAIGDLRVALKNGNGR